MFRLLRRALFHTCSKHQLQKTTAALSRYNFSQSTPSQYELIRKYQLETRYHRIVNTFHDWSDISTRLEAQSRNHVSQIADSVSISQRQNDAEMRHLHAVSSRYSALNTRFLDSLSLLEMAVQENDDELKQEVLGELDTLNTDYETLALDWLFSDESQLNKSDCYLSITAGAGGTESCDWVSMLYRMYLAFCTRRSFSISVMDTSKGEVAGYKSISVCVQGENAYGWLSTESGIHRLVRNSPFDTNDRRHTSFASVTVYPKTDEDTAGRVIDINPADLKVEVMRAGGAGGQHVNKTESAVRITHLPTKTVVKCSDDRSQLRNRKIAMDMLRSILYSRELDKQRQAKNAAHASLARNEWGSQVRSYVLSPYQMVKDLRTQHQTSNPKSLLEDGNLDDFLLETLLWKHRNKSR